MFNRFEYLSEPTLKFKYKGLGDTKLSGNNMGKSTGMLGSFGDLLGINNPLGLISSVGSGIMSFINGANPDLSDLENFEKTEMDRLQSQRNVNPVNSVDDALQQMSNFRKTDTSQYSADNLYEDKNLFENIAQHGLIGGISRNIFGDRKGNQAAMTASTNLINQARDNDLYRQRSYQNMIQGLNMKNNRDMFSQIAAYGGPLGISLLPVGGAVDYMQNEELLDTLGENKTKNNNSRVSMPMFAFGGALGGYGGDWSNGLTYIGAGGSHEQNPLGGVPAGMAQDGTPNQVEEGEYIWKDQNYVFSNRLYIPEEDYEALGLRKGKKKLTYADGAEILQKESAERPNDPISKRGKDAALMNLMQSQEQQRVLLAQQEQIEYAMGGGLSRDKDYGSKKKPYPKVKDKDFAGGGRSYPIPTKADAIDALRLAGLHGRSDVKAKVYKKYPELKKALGGHLFWPGGNITSPWNINGPLYKNESLFREEPKLGNNGFEKVILNNDIPTMLPFRMNGLQSPTDRYFGIYQSVNSNDNKKQTDPLPTSGWQTGLRYLPAIAPAISLGYSLFNGPDYSYADELDAAGNAYAEAIGNSGRVTPKFLGDYLAYDPFDRLFYANELGAQQAATNSAVMNLSSGNRGAALAGLFNSGYIGNIGLGKLYREGEEYNRAQRERVAEFNRGTNQYNSTLDMQAQELNARANQAKAEALLNNKYRVLGMKQAIDNQRDQSISLALTNLFNNLGGIGEDFVNRYDRNALINADLFGTLSQKPYGVSDADWQDYVNAHKKVFKAACGGKLNRKKKKGLTI